MPRVLLCCAVLAAVAAHADQCEAVGPPVAARAKALLKTRLRYVAYCEPCGDKAPGPVSRVKEVRVRDFSAQLREVWVDGRLIDLAYVFLETDPSSGVFKNLARLTDCPAQDVSNELKLPAPAKR